jgi:hypothetical protein
LFSGPRGWSLPITQLKTCNSAESDLVINN